MVRGRLTGLATGIIALRGNTGAGPYESQIEINVPENAQDHEALASLWARARVEDLMMQDYAAAQSGQFPDELRKQVIDLGIEFRLMTQFTSFVAVEEMTVTVGGEPVRVDVPVEMPAGVSYEGVFGRGAAGFAGKRQLYAPRRASGGARGVVLGGATGRPAPTAPPPMPLERAGVRELGDEEDELTVEEQTPASRLDEVLRDLAAKVEKDGQEGNLTLGKLKVTAWRVDVMIYLSDNSEKTLAALTELSFKQTGESKAVKLVVGTIDVRQLMKLVELEAVIRVRPVVAP
jgi:Ca-activated chloride channel family protein